MSSRIRLLVRLYAMASMPWICGSDLTGQSSQPTCLSCCWLPFSGAVALVVFETFDDIISKKQRNK
ncbi:hypothetical protein TSUD_383820 [Trifolium subterraneum]|uniref:Uncharacterized protein n=1 Tax=Trifolium subterraneum TaxID=3900 RepID=A0A2Z6NHK7_TRISU|nr:hypothetical protein TSUD_383820 [Trifolium subterraneum]